MTIGDWDGIWRKLLTDLTTDPEFQQTTQHASRLMNVYNSKVSDRGPDFLLRDEAGNITAVLEVKSFGGARAAWRDMSALMEEAASLISRAEDSEIVADAAVGIVASPNNAQALDKASSSLRKTGLTSRNPGLLLVLVLIWLLALGLPIALPDLPASDQTRILGELGTVAIAIALTDYLRRDH